jgi:alpha-glucoside transport system permease protein
MSVAPVAAPAAAPTPLVVDRGEPRRPFTLGSVPLHLVLILLTVIWVVPTLGLLVSSFRPGFLTARTGWWTAFAPPFQFTLQNYRDVLDSYNLLGSFINSLTIAIPATVIPIAIAAFAAYAFAWMKFPARNILFLALIGLLAVPLQVTLIPVLSMFKNFGLNGSFLGIWLAHTAFGLPLAVFLLRNFFVTLPKDLIEAARIDGASNLAIFRRIVVPLSVPALASFAIFQFLWVWNDLLMALIFVSDPSKQPMTVRIPYLLSTYGQEYNLLAAAAFLLMILPLIVFFSLQRYFVQGLLAGSVKT